MQVRRRFYRNTSHQLQTAMEIRAQRSQVMHDLSVTKAHCNELVSGLVGRMHEDVADRVSKSTIHSERSDSAGERNMECYHSTDLRTSSDSSGKLSLQVR